MIACIAYSNEAGLGWTARDGVRHFAGYLEDLRVQCQTE